MFFLKLHRVDNVFLHLPPAIQSFRTHAQGMFRMHREIDLSRFLTLPNRKYSYLVFASTTNTWFLHLYYELGVLLYKFQGTLFDKSGKMLGRLGVLA